MPYEAKRRNIQLCYPFSEDRLFNRGRLRSTWSPPYIYQDKLNGERCRVLVEPTRVLLFSSTNEFITTLPHINHQMSYFPPGEYDGELYVHGWTWAKIHSVVSTTMSIHPNSTEMQLHLFDIITDAPQAERIIQLLDCYHTVKDQPNIKRVLSLACWSLDDVMQLYSTSIENGYEGFVLKDPGASYIKKDPAYRSPYWMKFKPKKTDTYKVIDIEEAISKDGQPLHMIGAFTCVDPEGNQFKVGAGKLTHKERKEIWNNRFLDNSAIFHDLEIEYQTMSDAKSVPLFARAVKLIPGGK